MVQRIAWYLAHAALLHTVAVYAVGYDDTSAAQQRDAAIKARERAERAEGRSAFIGPAHLKVCFSAGCAALDKLLH